MRKRQIVAPFLLIIGLGLIIFSLYPETKKEDANKIAGVQTSNNSTSSPSQKETPEIKNTPVGITSLPIASAIKEISSPRPSVTNNNPTGNQPTASTSPSPATSPSSANQQIQVNVSINGGPSFTVTLDNGNNQCDVLTKALEQGKINSLNMQYNNTYGSYAVYQINGIGKENSVWWTYTVNGVSPTQGCSYIKANNGDTVEWKYIGS